MFRTFKSLGWKLVGVSVIVLLQGNVMGSVVVEKGAQTEVPYPVQPMTTTIGSASSSESGLTYNSQTGEVHRRLTDEEFLDLMEKIEAENAEKMKRFETSEVKKYIDELVSNISADLNLEALQKISDGITITDEVYEEALDFPGGFVQLHVIFMNSLKEVFDSIDAKGSDDSQQDSAIAGLCKDVINVTEVFYTKLWDFHEESKFKKK